MFVPVAFIPGVSGQLFRQFAVTVSVAMLISALNALTLSPALCAVFLRPTDKRRGIMGRVLRGIDYVRDGYAAVVRRLVRVAVLGVLLIALCAGGIWGISRITPTSFLPEEDQGAFFVVDAVARRRLGCAHARGGGADRGHAAAAAAGARGAVHRRLLASSTRGRRATPASWW